MWKQEPGGVAELDARLPLCVLLRGLGREGCDERCMRALGDKLRLLRLDQRAHPIIMVELEEAVRPGTESPTQIPLHVHERVEYLIGRNILPGGRQAWVATVASGGGCVVVHRCLPADAPAGDALLLKELVRTFFFLRPDGRALPLGVDAALEEARGAAGRRAPLLKDLWVLCLLDPKPDDAEAPQSFLVVQRSGARRQLLRGVAPPAPAGAVGAYAARAYTVSRLARASFWGTEEDVLEFLHWRLPAVYGGDVHARGGQDSACWHALRGLFERQTAELSGHVPAHATARFVSQDDVLRVRSRSGSASRANDDPKHVTRLSMRCTAAAQVLAHARGGDAAATCLILRSTRALVEQSTYALDANDLGSQPRGLLQAVTIFRQALTSQTPGVPLASWRQLFQAAALGDGVGLTPSPWLLGAPLDAPCRVNVHTVQGAEEAERAAQLCRAATRGGPLLLLFDDEECAHAASRSCAHDERVEIFLAAPPHDAPAAGDRGDEVTFSFDGLPDVQLRGAPQAGAARNLANACVEACAAFSAHVKSAAERYVRDRPQGSRAPLVAFILAAGESAQERLGFVAWETVLDEFMPQRGDSEGAGEELSWLAAIASLDGGSRRVRLRRRKANQLRNDAKHGLPGARTPVVAPNQLARAPRAFVPPTELLALLCGRMGAHAFHEQGASFVLAPLIWWSLAKVHYSATEGSRDLCVTRHFFPLAEQAFKNPNPELRHSLFKRAEAQHAWLPLLRRADGFLASTAGRSETLRTWATLLRHRVCEAGAPPEARQAALAFPACALVSLVEEAVATFVRLAALEYELRGSAAVAPQLRNLKKILFTFHGFVPVLPSTADEGSIGRNLLRAGVVPHINALFLRGETNRKRWLEGKGYATALLNTGTADAKHILANDLTLVHVLTSPLAPHRREAAPAGGRLAQALMGRRERALQAALAELDKELQDAQSACPVDPVLSPWVLFLSAFPPSGIAEAYSHELASRTPNEVERATAAAVALQARRAAAVSCGPGAHDDADINEPPVKRSRRPAEAASGSSAAGAGRAQRAPRRAQQPPATAAPRVVPSSPTARDDHDSEAHLSEAETETSASAPEDHQYGASDGAQSEEGSADGT